MSNNEDVPWNENLARLDSPSGGRRMDLERLFGEQLRKLRQKRSLQQEELAERCGMSVDAVRRLERGGFSPSLKTLQKLAVGLELSLGTLFDKLEKRLRSDVAEVCDYLARRDRRQVRLAWRVVRAMFEDASER